MAEPIPFQRTRNERGETRVLDALRREIRARQLSQRTEEAYAGWVRRYLRFHRSIHPVEPGAARIEQFLSFPANERRVSPSGSPGRRLRDGFPWP